MLDFVYAQNVIDEPVALRHEGFKMVSYLPSANPLDIVKAQGSTVTLQPGQAVKIPGNIWLTGVMRMIPKIRRITREEFEALMGVTSKPVEQAVTEEAPEEEPCIPIPPQDPPGEFICPKCGRMFARKHHLARHEACCTGETQ